MFTKSPVQKKSRESTAEEVYQTMARFSWIVEILDKLSEDEIAHAGDHDIRHGCQRALTAMLAELSRMEPAPEGRIGKAEKSVLAQLRGKKAMKLIDADQFQRFEQFIARIFNGPKVGTRAGHE